LHKVRDLPVKSLKIKSIGFARSKNWPESILGSWARIIQEIIKNAASYGYRWANIEALQRAWKNANPNNKKEFKEIGSKIYKCLNSGYFNNKDNLLGKVWKYVLKKELKKFFKVHYLPDEDNNNTDGCLGRQASRSKGDVEKSIKGQRKQKHSFVITKRSRTGKQTSKRRKSSKSDDDEVVITYVRCSEKQKGDTKSPSPSPKKTQSRR
jgi:hypothetical protein